METKRKLEWQSTGDQWRNNSRKNEGMEPKQKEHPGVDVGIPFYLFSYLHNQGQNSLWDKKHINL